MPDPIPAQLDAPSVPLLLCEKCRHTFPEDQFTTEIDGLESVCKRCLVVMGYRLKAGL